MQAVVIGGGAGARRAAGWLAAQGGAVTLITGGPDQPDQGALPEGRGAWIGDGGAPGRLLYGGTQALSLDRGVRIGGRTLALPLSARTLAQAIPASALIPAGRGWARARGAIELAELIGGGQEQRSLADWFRRRFGSTAFDLIYADYCQRRFGDPAEISCNVARLIHGASDQPPGALHAPLQPLALPAAVQVIRAPVDRIADGAVHTPEGAFSGRIFVDAPPATVLGWLGVPEQEGVHVDARRLTARSRVTVCVRGSQELPFETHVLDSSVRFYRITRPGLLPGFAHLADRLIAHYALDANAAALPDSALIQDAVDGLVRLGIPAQGAGAILRREPDGQPVWSGIHLSRLRRYALALEERGVRPVGRIGTHSLRDPSEEMGYLQRICEDSASVRACIRDCLEPPVQDPGRAHLRRIVDR